MAIIILPFLTKDYCCMEDARLRGVRVRRHGTEAVINGLLIKDEARTHGAVNYRR